MSILLRLISFQKIQKEFAKQIPPIFVLYVYKDSKLFLWYNSLVNLGIYSVLNS